MNRVTTFAFFVPLAVAAASVGCDDGADNPSSTGGATSGGATSGGSTAKGGSSPTGGTGAAAGSMSTGGVSTTGGAGGAATTGGVSTTGGAGGATTTGGVSTTGGAGGAKTTGGAGGVSSTGGAGGSGGGASSMMNFFVSSKTNETGKLGGLAGADQICQTLAAAVGQGSKTWRAYLSAANPATNAKDRIGEGPYYNAKGQQIAADKAALHADLAGDAELFLDETGKKINGQWSGSPTPNEHDILTGSQRDGTLQANATCSDWTSDSGSENAQLGHSDGLGPSMMKGMYIYWNSVHTSPCNNFKPSGGAGRIYCFVGP